MEALLDVSDKITISSTTYASTPSYIITAPNDKYIILDEIAIGGDSDFLANGKLQISINGSIITSKSSSSQEIGLISNLSTQFSARSFIFIEPQANLIINCRVTSGTATAQFLTTGSVVTKDEFKILRQKYTGL